jgi:O-acetylserine/cysteine efflux transporter
MRLPHLALALLVVLVWGFNFVVIEIGLQEIPPLLLCFARFFLTSIPAIFFVKFPSTSFKMVALYGLIMFALQFALLFMGMYAGVTPGLASLLLQTQVFFTILLAVLFLDEKLNRWQVIGALLSFSGIGLVGMNVGGSVTFSGFLLLIASAASWGTGNLISKKIGKVNMIALVVWGSLIAWPPLLAVSFFLEGSDRIFFSLKNLSWLPIGSILYITYLSTLFGFGVWSWLLHHYRLPVIAPFTLLVPIVAIVSSVLVFGEALQSWKIFAGILVIAGLCINLLGPRLFAKRL